MSINERDERVKRVAAMKRNYYGERESWLDKQNLS